MNVWLFPQFTETFPLGEIEPPEPAEAEIVYGPSATKVAAIVWFAVTFVNGYEDGVPTDTPSTFTSAIAKQAFGVIVNVWLPPLATVTAPVGEIVPPAPAEAVRVNVLGSPTAKSLKLVKPCPSVLVAVRVPAVDPDQALPE